MLARTFFCPYRHSSKSQFGIGGRVTVIDIALIRAHWADILRIRASIRSGTVTASLIMCQLASHPRQNGVAAALRELGRLERTLFTLD